MFASRSAGVPGWPALVLLSATLGGCAYGDLASNDTVLSMYVDPARYELFNCAQLRTVKKDQTKRIADLEALMAKAETGTGGSVVSEVAYRGDLNNARAHRNLADKVWRKNNCDSERLPEEKIAIPGKPVARDPLLPPPPYPEPAPIDQVYRR